MLNDKAIILGPTTAAMFKIKNYYRFQIVLKYKDFNHIKDALKYLDEVYGNHKKYLLKLISIRLEFKVYNLKK